MSEYVKLTYGSTDGSVSPASLQEVGRPLQMTMQGLSPNVQYYSQAELYDGLQLVSQSLQETFRTLSAGVITLTHVSDVRSGSNYVVTYSVSSTYALSSSIMSINGTNIQGQIGGNTISFVVSGLTMGQTYPYTISTIDIYTETNTTANSLVTVAQNYINITYSSRTSSSVTFDLDYVSDGGFYEGYIEYWDSSKNPATDQADGHTFFQDGADTVTQSNLDEGTTYKFRATIEQTMGGTEIRSSVVTKSTESYDYSSDYLTVTSTSAGNRIYWRKTNSSYSGVTIEASTDEGSTWNSFESAYPGGVEVARLGIGDKVIFRHTGTLTGSAFIFCSGECRISGNIASMQFGDNFKVTNQSPTSFASLFSDGNAVSAENLYLGTYSTMTNYCFNSMFSGCSRLTSAPKLPATTLAEGCYKGMFYGCTSLTNAPTLPAKSLAVECYSQMFYGCTSLTTAPTLQATTLAEGCYTQMFYGCTSLATSPTLPATTISRSCYSGMFNGCTSLTTAPELPATTLFLGCYENMFSGCTSLTTPPTLPAKTIEQTSYYQMFTRCTSLTESPYLLHVTSIGTNAMNYMFSGCTSLSVAYAPTPSSWETNKMRDWLYGVANSGTLFAEQSIAASIPTSSTSGVPSGWRINVSDAQPTDYFTITNQTNAANTISIVWQDMNGWEAQDIEFSTDGSNWDRVIATTAGATIATLPAFGSVKLRHTGTMQGNCFRGTGSHSVGGNIASLDLGSAYNVTDRTIPVSQFEQMFINDTTLVSAENLNFGAYSAANRLSCNQMFQGCTALVLPPDLSPIENHYGNQVFDMMFRGCTSLVKGTNLTKLKTYGWRAIFGMYGGCTALSELYYPDFQITNGEWWSIYGDFVDRTLGGNAYATQDTYDNITSGDSSQNGWDYVCPSQWNLNVL